MLKLKNNWKMLAIALAGISSASLLTGCVVRPVGYAYRPYCRHCHWHNHRHWRRRHGGCWVNRRGVMHCYG